MKHIAVNCILALLAVFAPAQGMIVASMSLIAFDLITGIWASKRRGENVTSAKLQRTVVKLMVYESAILLGFVAEHYLLSDAMPVSKMISGYIGMVELTSCLENLNGIAGGSLLKSLIVKLGSQNKE